MKTRIQSTNAYRNATSKAWLRHRCIFLFLAFGLGHLVTPSIAETAITIENKSKTEVKKLSDLIGFTGDKNKPTPGEELLKKKDGSDDINIAAGGQKNLTFKGDIKSITISWMVGTNEIENDIPFQKNLQLTSTFFESSFSGLYAVDCTSLNPLLPSDGLTFNVVNGGISGFTDFTFYDVTTSDGLIVRDSLGNPTSPFLDGVQVTASFQYSVTPVPEPNAFGLIVLGGLVLAGGSRCRRVRPH